MPRPRRSADPLQDTLQALSRLADAAVHASALSDILREALDCVERTPCPDRSSVLLFDPNGIPRFKAWRKLSEAYRREMEGHSPWSRVKQDPASMVLSNVAVDPNIDAFRATILGEGIHAVALVPISSDGSVLGRLSLYYDQPHAFSEEELAIARIIAAQIAFGIERIRKIDALRHRGEWADSPEHTADRRLAQRRLDAEHAVTRILADSQSLEEAVPRILASLGECLGCVFSAFWRAERGSAVIRCTETWQARGVSVPDFDGMCKATAFERGIGLPGRVWQSGTPAWISDLSLDPNFPRLRAAAGAGLKSGFAFPIKVKEKSLGVMELFLPHTAEPDDGLLAMTGAIGSEIGQFIERKETEEALAATEAITRCIINAALDAVITIDATGTIIGWNVQAERLFGWGAKEAIGRPLHETIIPERYRARHRYGLARYLAIGKSTILDQRVEIEGMRRDGTEFPAELTVTAIQSGGAHYFGAFVRDITERRRAERALEENEHRFRAMAEAGPEILFTNTPDGTSDYFSPRYFEYTGSSQGGVTLPERVENVHPEDVERVRARWIESLKSGASFDAEYRLQRKDGVYRWFRARSVPLLDGEGRVVKWYGVCMDIEDQKRTEERLKEANQAKDDFLAMLAHELRNPLGPIRTAAHVMNQVDVRDPVLDRARGIIDRQVRHMARLIDDLLDVSRISRGQILLRRERVDLVPLIEAAVEDHRADFDTNGHTVTLDLPTEPLWVSGDPTRLAQIVGNILQNANKFTEAGGTIRVSASADPGDQATVTIRDTGIGMDPRLVDRVFDTFSQADRSLEHRDGGLGLGLALVKGLVDLHGGSVSAASEGLGKGSQFTIRLRRSAAATPDPPAESLDGAPTRSCRVLLIEDHADSGEGAALSLRLSGHIVELVRNGREGVERAGEFHPDVVLCDIGLEGGMDGYAVARALRSDARFVGACLVAVTGYGREEDIQRSREAGFDRHLTKPVDPKMLEAMLREIAARRPAMRT